MVPLETHNMATEICRQKATLQIHHYIQHQLHHHSTFTVMEPELDEMFGLGKKTKKNRMRLIIFKDEIRLCGIKNLTVISIAYCYFKS